MLDDGAVRPLRLPRTQVPHQPAGGLGVLAGLWASDPQSQGIMFLAGNRMPVRKDLINSLIERFEESQASIVTASFAGASRSPVLFRRDLFPELLKLTGDQDESSEYP